MQRAGLGARASLSVLTEAIQTGLPLAAALGLRIPPRCCWYVTDNVNFGGPGGPLWTLSDTPIPWQLLSRGWKGSRLQGHFVTLSVVPGEGLVDAECACVLWGVLRARGLSPCQGELVT